MRVLIIKGLSINFCTVQKGNDGQNIIRMFKGSHNNYGTAKIKRD